MQENEFEKQLKNMMDGFKLKPSASVWEKVDGRLKENRRKKRPFIFFLFIILLVTGFLIYQFANQQPQAIKYANNKIGEGHATDSLSLKDSSRLYIEKNAGTNKPGIAANKNGYTDHKKFPAKTNNSTALIAKSGTPRTPYSQTPTLSNYNTRSNVEGLNVSPINNADKLPSVKQPEIQDNSRIDQTGIINDSTKLISDTAINLPSNKTFLQTDSIQIKQNKDDSLLKRTVKNPVNKNYTIPKWQWGITAFYGRSNAIESIVNVNKNAPSNLNNTPVNRDTPFYNSHPYSSSDAYQFGFTAQKKIIKNGFIAAGLNFIHLSTKADVNRKIDSAYTVQNGNSITSAFYVNTFYQPGPSETYTNIYNFIELPVYFQQDILYKHKLSFSYNAGFSVRQLISSNALIYNHTSNIYYSKDELLRKTQVQLMAGLNLKINTGKSSALYIGPQVSYSISNLFKNDDIANFHFMNYGLQASFMFHKK